MRGFFSALLFCLFIMLSYRIAAEELPLYASLTKNYPSSMVIPKWGGRIGINLGKVNDTIDFLDIREKEVGSFYDNLGLGDYDHYGTYMNLGITDTSMLSGTYLKRYIKYGSGTLTVNSYEIFLRKSFRSIFSIDLGIRGNYMDPEKLRSITDINFYINKYKPGASIDVDYERNLIWFYKEGHEPVAVYKTEDPYIKIYDSWDFTKYIRLTIGKAYYNFYPNVFIEYGKTNIYGKIDTNLKYYVPEGFEDILPKLPVNLDRDEDYFKIGVNTYIRTPFNTLTYFEYFYITINRDPGLGYEHYNHIFRAEINYFLSKHFVFFIGGIYLHRQFNGVIPFLYNKYTQTTFDHKYGWAEAGLVFIW